MEKKPILNIMVDLETASKKENAAIVSWAMVPFFTDGNEVEDAEPMELYIDLTSCFLSGMDFEKDTQDWWLKQDPKAKHSLINAEKNSIHSAAKEIYGWMLILSETYDLYLWSRGIDFDLPKVKWCFEHLLEIDEKDFPFKYSHKMDVRTVLKFMEIDPSQYEFEGVKHRALDDCMYDIRMICDAYRKKKGLALKSE